MHSVATPTLFAISMDFPRKFRPPVGDRNSQVLLRVGCAATVSARKSDQQALHTTRHALPLAMSIYSRLLINTVTFGCDPLKGDGSHNVLQRSS